MQVALKTTDDNQRQSADFSQHQSKDDLLLATNRFCDADTHSRLSTEQYKEAFYLLIGQAAAGTKQIVARTLSRSSYTPRSIALFFALEGIEISAPMLKNSVVLGQLDLMQLIEIKGEDVAAVIAQRPDIGPSVVKRLREFEDQTVQDALSENGALINVNTEKSADALFDKIEKRQRETVSAPPLTQAVVQAKPEPRLEAITKTNAEASLLKAAARGGRLDTRHSISEELSDFDFGPAVEKMAKARSHQGMAVLMQKRFGLTYETTQQMLGDKSGDTMAVLLRAAGVEAAQASRIQLLIQPTIGLSTHNARRAIRFYAQLNTKSCLEAVEQWPKMEKSATSHQPYMEDGKSAELSGRSSEATVKRPQETPLRATG